MTDATLDDLLRFLSAAPTPFHAVDEAMSRLRGAGFTLLRERDPWTTLAPGRYAIVHGATSLVAFVVPEGRPEGFRLVGAHTDSPNLRLKPHAEYTKEGYAQLGVEVYGGALLNSWFDRDLGIAGRVLVERDGVVTPHAVDLRRPLCRVAQLAIHLDRDVNDKGMQLNRQEHLAPLFGLAGEGAPSLDRLVLDALALGDGAIVGRDLMLYDLTEPCRGGPRGELVLSARLDNLAMCHAAVASLAAAADGLARGRTLAVAALFDHEEVGSGSDTGAESGFLPRVLERVARARGLSADDLAQAYARSLCVSADMAHAVHPNYASRHEERHKPVLNGGPVIKVNSQQRYATTASTGLLFARLCREAAVPVQHYAHRTDLPCGSTIGPIVSARLGMRTVDVGNPMLSMHSARELSGAHDAAMMTRVLERFYACEDLEP